MISGPISRNELESSSGFSRSATRRAYQTLIDMKWVTVRVSDGAFQLSSKLEEMISTAHFSSYECDVVQDMFHKIKSLPNLHVTLSTFTAIGVFDDIESTRMPKHWKKGHSLVHSPAAITALSIMTKETRLQYLSKYIKITSYKEVTLIEDATFNTRIADMNTHNALYSEDGDVVHFPWLSSTGAACTISIMLKTISKQEIRKLKEQEDEFRAMIAALETY